MKTTYLIAGIVLSTIGAVTILYSMGYLGFTATQASLVGGGILGGGMRTSRLESLSTVVPGATYQWKIDIKNTGTVSWDGYQIVLGLFTGDYSGIVKISGWVPQYKEGTSTTWVSPEVVGDTATIDRSSTPVAVNEMKTFYVKLTIPSGTTGTINFKPTLMGRVGSTWTNLAAQVDTLTMGAISGTLVLSLIGALSLLGGLATTILALRL